MAAETMIRVRGVWVGGGECTRNLGATAVYLLEESSGLLAHRMRSLDNVV